MRERRIRMAASAAGSLIVLSLCLAGMSTFAAASGGTVIYVPTPTGIPEDDWNQPESNSVD